jgi:hypothetical protein
VDAATVVWIAPDGSSPQAESGAGSGRPKQAERALEPWGSAHALRLRPPSTATAPRLPFDEMLADKVEEELEKARDASSALDADAAERSLAEAETTLRQHPELPQAAWLMAEVERGWARRWGSVPPKDPDRAIAAWKRAQGLDGGREPSVGEVATTTSELPVSFQVVLDGEGEMRLDGRPVTAGTVAKTPGEHQLTVTRRGTLVWAGWIGVAEGTVVRIAPPEPPPCSAFDFATVSVVGTTVRATGVRCDLWVAAKPEGDQGKLFVALCRRDRCDALLEWRSLGTGPPVPVGPASTWPAWATWTLVGVGAAAIAGVTVGLDVAFHSGASTNLFDVGGCHGCSMGPSKAALEPGGLSLVKKR